MPLSGPVSRPYAASQSRRSAPGRLPMSDRSSWVRVSSDRLTSYAIRIRPGSRVTWIERSTRAFGMSWAKAGNVTNERRVAARQIASRDGRTGHGSRRGVPVGPVGSWRSLSRYFSRARVTT